MAGRSHTTRTPHRMNEALGRNALGFVARQNVANADFRKAIYVRPHGKGFHWVRNPVSGEEYVVSDGLGGATVAPGSTVGLLSYHGMQGETLATRAPAGFGGTAINSVTRTPTTSPPSSVPSAEFTHGYYRGWSYYCDGGSYVWLACVHNRFRFNSGPVFVDGTAEVRVAKLAVSAITGSLELAYDGYEVGEFENGVGGTEVFRRDPIALSSLEDFYVTVSVIASSGLVFVVYTRYGTTNYVIECLSDTGSLLGADSFSGRAWESQPDDLNKNSAIISPSDGNFYFAHPIGAGDEEFRICRRGSDASVQAYIDINFSSASKVYVGISERPSSAGVRVFANDDASAGQFYKDFDEDMSAVTGWVSMAFGPDNHYETADSSRSNSTVRVSTGYAVLGTNASGDRGIFLIDNAGAIDSEVGDDDPDSYPPIYKGPSGSFIYGSSPVTTQAAIRRMLSDGSIA